MSSSLVHGMRFGKPILAKSINANIELLGDDYEGLFSSVSDAVTTLGRLFELESGDNASTDSESSGWKVFVILNFNNSSFNEIG